MTRLYVPDTATIIDHEIHSGETWNMDFEVVDKFGAPFPTTGCTVIAAARDVLDGTTAPYFTWSGAATGIAVGSATSIRLLTTAAQTGAWLWRTAVYDVKLTTASGDVGYIAKGTLTIIPHVS